MGTHHRINYANYSLAYNVLIHTHALYTREREREQPVKTISNTANSSKHEITRNRNTIKSKIYARTLLTAAFTDFIPIDDSPANMLSHMLLTLVSLIPFAYPRKTSSIQMSSNPGAKRYTHRCIEVNWCDEKLWKKKKHTDTNVRNQTKPKTNKNNIDTHIFYANSF